MTLFERLFPYNPLNSADTTKHHRDGLTARVGNVVRWNHHYGGGRAYEKSGTVVDVTFEQFPAQRHKTKMLIVSDGNQRFKIHPLQARIK